MADIDREDTEKTAPLSSLNNVAKNLTKILPHNYAALRTGVFSSVCSLMCDCRELLSSCERHQPPLIQFPIDCEFVETKPTSLKGGSVKVCFSST